MKRRMLFASLAALLAVLLALPVLAHPGRTDSKGGHFDHSSGTYHYHHGYPAHQHRDLDGDGKPDCPYDFDDKTNHSSSGSSSSSSGSSSSRINPTVKPTQSLVKSRSSDPSQVATDILGVVIPLLSVAFCFYPLIRDGLVALWNRLKRGFGSRKERKEEK